MSDLNQKINDCFAGLVVRKDLVKEVKGNAIVPTYVLEYLLGQYCATDDEASIISGIETVKEILSKHYVHRNEAGLVRSNIKKKGRYKIIDKIKLSYVILFNKIFVLENLDGKKIMLTYNVDMRNSTNEFAVDNTILVHRKKQTNTLYTINALNELIKSLNNGVLDKKFPIEWENYQNCILLIQTDGFNRIDTKIKEIINLS